MYELNNQIRLIKCTGISIDTAMDFIGFICGIICQDHDLEQMYLDSFLKLPASRERILKRPTRRWRPSVRNIM